MPPGRRRHAGERVVPVTALLTWSVGQLTTLPKIIGHALPTISGRQVRELALSVGRSRSPCLLVARES